jgi:hypothetical protein
LAGNITASLIQKIKKNAPKIEVIYKGYLTHKSAIALMKSGDLLLNFIFKGADRDMISGKLLEYLASEVPVLSIGNPKSEAGRLLDECSLAQMIDSKNSIAIQKFIGMMIQKKDNAKNQWEGIERWSRENITAALNDILEQGKSAR